VRGAAAWGVVSDKGGSVKVPATPSGQGASTAGLTRRTLLRGCGIGALGLVVAPVLPPGALAAQRGRPKAPPAPLVNPQRLRAFEDALPVPPLWSAATLEARGLTMAEGRHTFHRKLRPSRTWGYGGMPYLGPTIEVPAGRPVSYVARNRLGTHPLPVDRELHGVSGLDAVAPRTSLHLHGGYVEPESDGYPEDTFRPGEDQTFDYPNDQQSGTIWYHDHALGITRLNVYAGLAGYYLIRDEYDTGGPGGPLDMPSPLGQAGVPVQRGGRELPLVLQDKSFLAPRPDQRDDLHYPASWEPEFFGNVPVVNGKVRPYLDVDRSVWRFRLLNGSGSRFYSLRLAGAPVGFIVIGTDNGLLPEPVPVPSGELLVVAPGERVDVLVDLRGVRRGTSVRLVDEPLPEPAVTPAPGALGVLAEMRVGDGHDPAGFPSTLRPHTRLAASDAVRERTVTLVEIMGPDGPVMALLNNRPWDYGPTERPSAQDVEVWNLVNLTEDTHPIHLHLVQFQLAERRPFDADAYLQAAYGVDELMHHDVGSGSLPPPHPEPYYTGSGTPPLPWEAGWKDTVQAHPGEVTRIVVPFSAGAFATATGRPAQAAPFGGGAHVSDPLTGRYVWHCHILEHEDNEMMLPYEVTA
jgi:spore coat protein A, manganese oxidase